MRYASGKNALAICDRCSQTYPYLDLMADGANPALRVCQDCYDDPDPIIRNREPDPQALAHPRPDVRFDVPPPYVPLIPDPPGQFPPDEEGGQ